MSGELQHQISRGVKIGGGRRHNLIFTGDTTIMCTSNEDLLEMLEREAGQL